MREIKFRGKRLDNGEWVDGFVLFNHDKSESVIAKLTDTESVCENVVLNTVGQFTGLHDKNGKEIYEGDVLFVREWNNIALAIFDHDDRECLSLEDCKGALLQECQRIVYFEEGSMCAGDYYISTLWDKQDQRHQYPIFEVEIIGNIHDNPELLKSV